MIFSLYACNTISLISVSIFHSRHQTKRGRTEEDILGARHGVRVQRRQWRRGGGGVDFAVRSAGGGGAVAHGVCVPDDPVSVGGEVRLRHLLHSRVPKSSLSYDQRTFNTLSFFKDLGNNVSVVSGVGAPQRGRAAVGRARRGPWGRP